MHIVIATRGIKHSVDRFINELSAKYLPYTMKKKKGKKYVNDEKILQVRVCPISLYDISFPEPHKDAMINTLFPDGDNGLIHSRNQKYLTALRFAMKMDKLPKKRNMKVGKMPLFMENIEVMGIGIKKDRYENGQEMI